jgi:hypothetical protein
MTAAEPVQLTEIGCAVIKPPGGVNAGINSTYIVGLLVPHSRHLAHWPRDALAVSTSVITV